MFRVTCRQLNQTTMVVVPEGSLVGASNAALNSTVATVIQNGFHVDLDLSGLQFVDTEGVAALSAMKQSGVNVRSPSPFVSELLKQNG